SFSYFDPINKFYKTAQSKKIFFKVTPATIQVAKTGKIKKTADNPGQALPGWGLGAGSLLLIAALIWYFKKSKTTLYSEKMKHPGSQIIAENDLLESSSQNQHNPLAVSEKCLHDPDCTIFYSSLMNEIKHFLSVKFFIPVEKVNSKSLSEKMDKMNISNETVLSFQQLLRDIEWQLYTPFERNEKMQDMYTRSHELMQIINTYNIKSP
ncbi:MAG: hypothetical protein ABIP80_03195, partial [Ferruginibacter sp.]